jgi:predicted secreted protein with PEFG-CTERM motif
MTTIIASMLALAGGMNLANAQTALTVSTDKPSYVTGDYINVTGNLTATIINEPLLIIVKDPQGGIDNSDQFDVAADGSYFYKFRSGGLMNTDGVYRVTISYKGTTKGETTFNFDAVEAPAGAWKTIQASIGGQNHAILYKITGSGNSLISVTGNVDTKSFLASLSTQSDGILSLRFDQGIFDAKDFTASLDKVQITDKLPAGPGVVNEIHIDFKAGTKQIEITGDTIIPEFGAVAIIVLAVAIIGIIVATAKFSALGNTGKIHF